MKAQLLASLLLASIMSPLANGIELSQFKYNGATDDTSRQSTIEILSQLSGEKKVEFLDAIKRIQFGNLRKEKPIPLGQMLNGMSYEEILTFSKTLPDLPQAGASH
jgi:hypothetical protein